MQDAPPLVHGVLPHLVRSPYPATQRTEVRFLFDDEALACVLKRHPRVERVLCGHVHRAMHAAWANTVVGQSFLKGSMFEAMIKDGVDPVMVEGARDCQQVASAPVAYHAYKAGHALLATALAARL